MNGYWPWWAGAIGLAATSLGYYRANGRTFGVSSSWERLLNWGDERRTESFEAQFQSTVTEAPLDGPHPQTVATQAVFVIMALVGGFLAATFRGAFEFRADMGQAFSDVVVDGPWMWPVLFVGGVMVGFGTRMAGGCSSGHGLNGFGRLEPASILATITFFGTAVVVSMLLWKVI